MNKSNQVTSVQSGKKTDILRLRSLADELERMDAKAGKYKEDEAKEVMRSIVSRVGPEFSLFNKLESKHGCHPECKFTQAYLSEINSYRIDNTHRDSIDFAENFVWYLVKGTGGHDYAIEGLYKQIRIWADLIEKEPDEITSNVPPDLIPLSVATQKFHASRKTIKQAIYDKKIKTYRKADASRTTKHKVSESELDKYWPRKT
jgi:hypothetical protein